MASARRHSSSSQAGFTLIELIIVIVIIAVLAAVGAPRFFDLSDEAKQSAVENAASNITAANTLNYAKHLSGSSAEDVSDCLEAAQLSLGDGRVGGPTTTGSTFRVKESKDTDFSKTGDIVTCTLERSNEADDFNAEFAAIAVNP
ncbi:prepilin-type N-terminal cleavage/methylation domain-containing protein [Ectothiorhodospira haloalkaliphila]|uniref:prepilin-type N-terminal cleavage/methylation domain-containing protein n=1 Tax=Ectothiorhodospira haloalkaliphila TaxID=421628 RepID=UPI0023785DD4|nr:prepilin-type N-terminal cleavage/methylation domain-containing protein [Ectothiorhodospira haloalkaliphila]